MTKQILLTQGKVALVDDEDFERINRFKWCASKYRADRFYAMRSVGPWLHHKTIYMHRVVIGATDGKEVDHINGNGLDNRRANIRVCTRTENTNNRGKCAANTSGFKGVVWDAHRNKWRAQIKVNGKGFHVGYYSNPEVAARAYDEAAKKHQGKFAHPNFG